MRALLALVMIMVLFIFMLPFVLSLVAVVVIFSVVLTLTARFLPAGHRIYRSRGVYFDVRSNKKNSADIHPEEDEKGWYQDIQEGEVVSLPEDCLKKRS